MLKRSGVLASVCLLLVASWSISGVAQTAQTAQTTLNPGADYSPADVVRIVLDALQGNDPDTDQGIATVFRFASPGNRSSTGPLSRFTQMIKRGFPDMLNYTDHKLDPMEITGDTAVQAVWLEQSDGKVIGYAFQLGKQGPGSYEGAWMTEAVVPLGPGADSGTRL